MAANTPHQMGKPVEFQGDEKGEMRIPPKDLNIVWGGDGRYWTVPEDKNLPAELNQVYWFELTGCVSGTDPNKGYEVRFHIRVNPDAFGWAPSYPLYVMVKRRKNGKSRWQKFPLDPKEKMEYDLIGKVEARAEAADIRQGSDDDERNIYFGLYEVWSGKWKGGLKIDVFIRETPKPNAESSTVRVSVS